ncbi:MAG: flagellar export chaperone FliS [Fimbriimonadia bacterium]|nr:flagellar export chaperone FliS [Fimbriimonadia bacterium]
MYSSASDQQLLYLETAVETAHPTRLIVMLYDGAIRFLCQAEEAMLIPDYEKQNHFIVKAQRIVAELMSSLNLQEGGEVAENLLQIYAYLYNQLVEANLNDQRETLEHVRHLLSELREAWDTIASQEEVPCPPTQNVKVSLHG